MAFQLVGEIYNNDHPATPVVVGDVETLRASWSSELEGEDEAPSGLFVPDLEGRSPVVLVDGDDIWLVAEDHDYGHLQDQFSVDELVKAASAEASASTRVGVVAVTSGTLGIALASIDGGDLPEVPSGSAARVEVAASDDAETKALVAVAVPPGDYEVTVYEAVDVGIRKSKYEEEPERKDARLFLRARIRRAAP